MDSDSIVYLIPFNGDLGSVLVTVNSIKHAYDDPEICIIYNSNAEISDRLRLEEYKVSLLTYLADNRIASPLLEYLKKTQAQYVCVIDPGGRIKKKIRIIESLQILFNNEKIKIVGGRVMKIKKSIFGLKAYREETNNCYQSILDEKNRLLHFVPIDMLGTSSSEGKVNSIVPVDYVRGFSISKKSIFLRREKTCQSFQSFQAYLSSVFMDINVGQSSIVLNKSMVCSVKKKLSLKERLLQIENEFGEEFFKRLGVDRIYFHDGLVVDHEQGCIEFSQLPLIDAE